MTAIVFKDPDDDLLKLFPASTTGPDHVSATWGPLGDIPVVFG
jgi:2-dehydro-3-deoxyphosphogluconate aldolase/(4S)-4-hydroxy-2-oxoglutarate aldolase